MEYNTIKNQLYSLFDILYIENGSKILRKYYKNKKLNKNITISLKRFMLRIKKRNKHFLNKNHFKWYFYNGKIQNNIIHNKI